MTLDELELFFESEVAKNYLQLNKVIEFNKWEKIIDSQKFIQSHIGYLKANSGNARFIPYYDRLVSLKDIINERDIQKNKR